MPLMTLSQVTKLHELFHTTAYVISKGDTAPPWYPADGDAYIPGVAATEEWYGYEDSILVWLEDRWFVLQPVDGLRAYVADEDAFYKWDGYGLAWTLETAGGSGAVGEDVAQATHGFAVGNAIYHNGTIWAKAKADAVATLGTHLVSAVADADNFSLVQAGKVEGLSGLTAGTFYFVSAATAGELTSTEPVTYSNPILMATSTTTGYVLPFRAAALTGATTPDILLRWTAASAVGPASLDFLEDADNGTSKITLTGQSSLAGDIIVTLPATAGTLYVSGGTDVAVADGGTGSSTAVGAATNLGLGTGDSPQFTAVNIGHATDTTLTRVSAGVVAIEGVTILTTATGQPLTASLTDISTRWAVASASGAASLDFLEDTDNGTNKTTLIGQASLGGDIIVTLPATAGTLYVSGGTDVVVADGGTGLSSATAYAVLCGGTTSTGAFQSIASVGTPGQVLTSNGPDALPTFQAASAGTTDIDVQIFTGSGTWTKPANARDCDVYVFAPGAGGGSGGCVRDATAGNCDAGGGGGGQAGGVGIIVGVPAEIFAGTETVTLNAAGTGGAGRTTSGSQALNGNDGNNGGTASFGTWISITGADGGSGGVGSPAGSGAGGNAGTGAAVVTLASGLTTFAQKTVSENGLAGTAGALAASPTDATDSTGWGPGGGGGGSGVTNAVEGGQGGDGGNGFGILGTANDLDGGAGANVGTGPVAGSVGTSTTANYRKGGGGGGGGAGEGSSAGVAGAGGNGGIYGGGGGGGGGMAHTGSNGTSGAGGNGAAGIIIVITYCGT